MFLKSIEIFGFKSFADKSRIDFGEGISTIVGPNGCGKSNVVEAIRWVLGEQSSKGIRLEKMDNVIFNGTEQRHPLNVAEVTLIFSNEDNILPLEFSEVAIKRRIFRSSTSEYYINDSQVSLKELREIIADTGIGMTEYIVMEQGRIDQILEAKPVERRGILEEAAGIKKFRMRSLEGTRRREKVQENIKQIEQLLVEVEKQHKTLKSQSEKAIKHRALSDISFSCEVLLSCKKYWDYSESLSTVRSKEEKEIQNLEKEEENLKKLENENKEFESHIKSREAESIELQRRLSVIHTEKDGVKNFIVANTQHIEDTTKQYDSFKQQITSYQERKKEQEAEMKTLSSTRDTQLKKIENTKKTIEENLSATEKNKTAIKKLHDSKNLLVQRQEHIRKALDEHQHELRTVVDRLAEELDKRISQSGYSAKEQHEQETLMLNNCQALKKEVKLLQTYISKQTKDKKDLDAKKLEDSSKEILKLSNLADETFRKYRDSVPTFLNEFLDNDGVLSHKHIIDEKINELHKEQEECRATHTKLLEQIEELEINSQKLIEQKHHLEIEQNSNNQQLESIAREENRMKFIISDLDQQIMQQKERLEALEISLNKWKESQKLNETKLKDLDKEQKQREKEVEALNAKIGKQQSEVSAFQKKIQQLFQKIQSINKLINQHKEKITDLEARLIMLSENFRDRHGEMINIYLNDEVYKKRAKESVDDIKKRLIQTKQEIQNLGSVNLLAAEEFERVDERYQHLVSQLNDLVSADKNLQEVVEKIEQESRLKMEETFKEVRKHFKTIFTRVMGGGKADLELIDSEDILTAGLEILAQPPQKKTQYLSQLSGGERTLIALSLLFALHSVKPAPFCLLDELDAPLDDRNIDRFLELLHSFKEVTQFVVISHNKRSIAQAQNIIGVTMEERGVSKFIGVKINEETAI